MVISSSFADIHKNNELNNFVLPVTVPESFLGELFESIAGNSGTKVRVDVPAQTVTNLSTGSKVGFELSAYKKYCFMNALDDIDYLLENKERIQEYESKTSKY